MKIAEVRKIQSRVRRRRQDSERCHGFGRALCAPGAAGALHSSGVGLARKRQRPETELPSSARCTRAPLQFSGVSFVLKLLTLLYIGGASSSAALMRCQHTDGGAWTVAACSCQIVSVSLIFDFRQKRRKRAPARQVRIPDGTTEHPVPGCRSACGSAAGDRLSEAKCFGKFNKCIVLLQAGAALSTIQLSNHVILIWVQFV